jgi:CoA:oxalate CoA-transferase
VKALEGLKVLDLTHALAGPFCTYQLQLLGAEIWKIERPELGDDFRDFARPDGWSVGPSFVAVNGGKRSITVNLKAPEGAALVRRLAGQADVVVENLRPGVAEKLGLGWEALRAANPRLVYCSISGFGQTGEMRDWPAYDHTIKAMAGMMWTGGDDVPSQGRGFSVDCFSGYVAYASILSALLRRERTGEGQRLDVSMLDSSLVLMGVGLVRQMITGDDVSPIQPIAHERPTVAPYRTRDGWLWLSVNFQNQYEILCKELDAPELLTDPRFSDVRARNRHGEALRKELARRLEDRSAAELETRLMAAGCPAARVRLSRETLEMEQLRERGMLAPSSVAESQPVTLLNAGFLADADGPELSGPVPALGADTEAVLAAAGLSDAEIRQLRDKGVI